MTSRAGRGTDAAWYEGWSITDEKRAFFRERAVTSQRAKRRALTGQGPEPLHEVNKPSLDPATLMPQRRRNGLRALSLFSGGGGLDLGFDRAGFVHVASFEILDFAGDTLRLNRKRWRIESGRTDGDVRGIDWRAFRGEVEVLHGGPPCQPFSAAGRQRGGADAREMFPEFVRAVCEVVPRVWVAENVAALAGPKFAEYVRQTIREPLLRTYRIEQFVLRAEWFGVPQTRQRLFLVGVHRDEPGQFDPPAATHTAEHVGGVAPPRAVAGPRSTMGTRQALGLADIGFDRVAPTIRSALTGPRGTTSVLNSVSSKKVWDALSIWPNGVAATREAASAFVPENGHFRMSVGDVAVLQGFPESWRWSGAVYAALGQIGNAVAPPVGYAVARAVAAALS